MKLLRHSIYSLLALALLNACDDNTGNMGIFPETDGISNSVGTYSVFTKSMQMNSVIANNTNSYLGDVTDPETGTSIHADFIAQFATFENYSLPEKSMMVAVTRNDDGSITDKVQGTVKCDSCEVRLYFDDYYGDSNNPMKVDVYQLDKALSENSTFYTDTDLMQYVASGATPIASRVFTPSDYNLSDTELNSSSHTDNVHITLPATVGQKILDNYYAHPDNFKDSYTFTHNVLPGLLFRANGTGTMLRVYVSTINIYFNYTEAGKPNDIQVGVSRFSATPEVIQSTRFENGDMGSLAAQTTHTYLKTPAGICTEMELPVDEVFESSYMRNGVSYSHKGDSISQASISFVAYNKVTGSNYEEEARYELDTPGTLLLVRKSEMSNFFKNREVADNRTSFTAGFNSSNNTYTFSNIGRLLSYLYNEKRNAILATLPQNHTDAEYAAASATWEAANPEWNHAVLIPVTTNSNSSGNMVSVSHDMSLSSIRLVGGTTKPIELKVVYSTFR